MPVVPFVVHTEADLRKLLWPEQLFHPFRKPQVLIRVPELTQSEASDWERRLENFRKQCGCTAGAVAIGAFALASVAYALHSGSPATSNPLSSGLLLKAGVFVTGLILSAVFGKLLGLSAAMVRYRQTCFELMNRLQTIDAAPTVTEYRCNHSL